MILPSFNVPASGVHFYISVFLARTIKEDIAGIMDYYDIYNSVYMFTVGSDCLCPFMVSELCKHVGSVSYHST